MKITKEQKLKSVIEFSKSCPNLMISYYAKSSFEPRWEHYMGIEDEQERANAYYQDKNAYDAGEYVVMCSRLSFNVSEDNAESILDEIEKSPNFVSWA